MFFAHLHYTLDNFIIIIRRSFYLLDARRLKRKKEKNIRNVNACDCREDIIFHLYYLVFSVANVEIRDFAI